MSGNANDPDALRCRVQSWSDRTVVDCAGSVSQLVNGAVSVAVDFERLRGLRLRCDALDRALEHEARADTADEAAEAQAVAAQQRLLDAVRPRLEDVVMATFRAELRSLVDVWADPYAQDATGREQLARVHHRLSDGPSQHARAMGELRQVVEAMERAGLDRDDAHRRRLGAIAVRVEARQQADKALLELLAILKPAVVLAWLEQLDTEPARAAPEDTWFVDED